MSAGARAKRLIVGLALLAAVGLPGGGALASSPQIDFDTALVWVHRGDYAQAFRGYTSVINNPAAGDTLKGLAYYYRGLLNQRNGDLNAALSDFNRAIKLEGRLAPAYLARAELFNRGGRSQKAQADLAAYRRLRPQAAAPQSASSGGATTVGPQTGGGGAVQGATANLLLAQLNRAIAAHKTGGRGLAELYDQRGALWLEAGRTNQALNDFNRALTADANYAPAFYSRSLAWEKLGRLDQALADVRRCLDLSPNMPYAQLRLKKLQGSSGGVSAGAATGTSAGGGVDRSGGDAQVNRQLDRPWAANTSGGRLRGRALAEAWDQRGWLIMDSGLLQDALTAFSRAIQADSGYAQAYYNRSMAWEKLGRLDKARADAEAFARLSPNNDYGRRRLKMLAAKGG